MAEKTEKIEEKVKPKEPEVDPPVTEPEETVEPPPEEIRREVIRRVKRAPDEEVDLDDAPDAWAEEERERLDRRVSKLEDARKKKRARSFLDVLPILVLVGIVLFVKLAEKKGWRLPWQKSA